MIILSLQRAVHTPVRSLLYLVLLQMAYSDAEYIEASQVLESSGEDVYRRRKAEDSEEIDQDTVGLLVEKWTIFFKYLDHNKDKIINEEDVAMEANVFSQVYNLEEPEKEDVKEQLKNFFLCFTFNELEKGVSMEKFVAQVVQFYKQNKAQTIQHLRECSDIMVYLLDHNNDGFMSLDELSLFYKDVNMGNKNLIKTRYRKLCSDAQARCPIKKVSNAWTEILIGTDKKTFLAFKQDYKNNGMPLEDLVE